jgi:hypothetical protein
VVDTEPEPVKKWHQKILEGLKNLLGKWWKKKNVKNKIYNNVCCYTIYR